MKNSDLFEYRLPSKIYRRFLILTDAWEGSRATEGSLLIKVHEGGDGIPLFWCGTPDTLPGFYKKMGYDRSIYCFCGTFGVLPPTEETITALGKYYTAEIVKSQPNGPYLLGGFCEAGLISYEVARNMHLYDYKVALLVMFEVDVTRADYWLLLAREAFRTREKLVSRRKQFAVDPKRCIEEILINKWQYFVIKPLKWARNLVSQGTVTQKQAEPLLDNKYKLATYPGDVDFIYIKWGLLGYFQFKFFQRYWNVLVQGNKDFTVIMGSVHNSPNWHAVAKIIKEKIKNAGF
ncbi:MAG: hypothetical protein ABL933_15595 [Methyloglobulus sp.]|nr:hypothetical protein [Methyloglobulus sp.]